MTPREFVKAWLPDYEEKWQETLRSRPRALVYDVRVGFIEKYHSEALAAFAKAQREECAECASFDYNKLRDSCGLGSEYYEIDRDSIMEAPIPTPKNE